MIIKKKILLVHKKILCYASMLKGDSNEAQNIRFYGEILKIFLFVCYKLVFSILSFRFPLDAWW